MERLIARLMILLLVAQLLLLLLSWLLSAMMTEGVRPLLSSEGIRWLFSQFTAMMLRPQLVWLILLSMAVGCLWQSGIVRPSLTSFRRSFALRVAAAVLLLLVAVVALLIVPPHAILLSSTGSVWPSPFSRALVPILSAVVIVTSSCYGILTRDFLSSTDVLKSMKWGLSQAAPLLTLYFLLVLFYESLCYVFL